MPFGALFFLTGLFVFPIFRCRNPQVANLATVLDIDIDQVSVKAKTGEKVDAVGEQRAVRA